MALIDGKSKNIFEKFISTKWAACTTVVIAFTPDTVSSMYTWTMLENDREPFTTFSGQRTVLSTDRRLFDLTQSKTDNAYTALIECTELFFLVITVSVWSSMIVYCKYELISQYCFCIVHIKHVLHFQTVSCVTQNRRKLICIEIGSSWKPGTYIFWHALELSKGFW